MTPGECNSFNNLLADQQYQVIAQAIENKNILWRITRATLYPQFKDKDLFVQSTLQMIYTVQNL